MKHGRVAAAGLAAVALFADSVGTALVLANGRQPAGWQLTCLGVGVPAALLGLLITWHRPRNRIAWIILTGAVGFGLDQLGLALLAAASVPAAAQHVAYWLLLLMPGPLTSVWLLLILVFPDGRFQRAAWRRYAMAACGLSVLAAITESLFAPPGYLPAQYGLAAPAWLQGPLAIGAGERHLVQPLDLPGLLLPFVALIGLVDRFRHSSTTVRQQIKWLLAGASLEVVVAAVFLVLQKGAGLGEPAVVSLLVAPLPTLGAALAIFKYRLWEIDRLVSRTLAFAVLWVLSTGGFFGLAAVTGVAVGGTSARLVAAVALALLIALLLQPLRGRLEGWITRVVYGPRPHGYAALGTLTETAAASLPVPELANLIASVAMDSVGLHSASVWLLIESDGQRVLRRAGDAPVADGPAPFDSVILDSRQELSLDGLAARLPGSSAALLPLELAAEWIGVLACGAPRNGELGGDERLVLASVARQGAILLRSGRLEEQLRHRLRELRESRQRLVTAQDEERRRLERDLHDGVQQQLVGLAARLRSLARPQAAPPDFEALADEAEDAVFAMQDLARGIYPSVLIDQGLAPALSAAAARLPIDVQVEVEPGLAELRLTPEAEACLYFVGMEAITNAQKHAHGSPVLVTVRSGEPDRSVALEVHDHGTGFDPGRVEGGSGLLNMRDRLAALGGRLEIRSEPGAGTWVSARLPLAGDLLPLQRPGVVARR